MMSNPALQRTAFLLGSRSARAGTEPRTNSPGSIGVPSLGGGTEPRTNSPGSIGVPSSAAGSLRVNSAQRADAAAGRQAADG
jgi:hypothetical protein